MADNCDESAGSGQKVCCGENSASSLRASGKATLDAYASRGVSMRCLTTGLWRSCSVRSVRSFHIRNFANENMDSTTSSETSQPLTSLMACATRRQMAATSMPASSRDNSPSPTPRSSLKSCRSISSNVGLKRASSSWDVIVKPDRALLRFSVTGNKIRGALMRWPGLSSRFHTRKPSARNMVLAPPSCIALRAPRYRSISRASMSGAGSRMKTSRLPSASLACSWRTSSFSRVSCSALLRGSAPSMRSG